MVTISNAGVLAPVSIPGYALNSPGAVALDGAGDLFIADSYNSRVIEVPSSGSPFLVAGVPDLSLPVALTVDSAGNLYIGDANKLAVYKVAPKGSPATVTITNATNLLPQALTTNGSGGPSISRTVTRIISMSCLQGAPRSKM